MTILTSETARLYKAAIHSDLLTGFKKIYTASSKNGEEEAAVLVVRKNFGDRAATTVREVRDASEIAERVGRFFKDPKRKQVFRVWSFDR